MCKKIFSIFKTIKFNRPEITRNQYQEIVSNINITNWKRIRIFLVLTCFFELLLIIFNDIPAINASAPESVWLSRSYLILHSIIGTVSFFSILLFGYFLKKAPGHKPVRDYYSPGINLIILVCLSIITGLDQIQSGQISVFVINLLVCSVLLLVPGRISFFLFTIPYGIFIIGVLIYQSNAAIRYSHFINGGIFLVAALLLSKFMYDNFFSHLVKNIKLEEANQKLLVLSLHDPLTNLSNRRKFEVQVEHELALVKRFNQQSWLILVDIDHFKDINDRYGHNIGDRVLKDVAVILQQNIRDVDLACRWGGEEFLLLITRTNLEEVKFVANRLCTELAQTTLNIDGQGINVTASFGVARLTFKGSGEGDFQTSLQLADQSLYSAKQNGRNQVVVARQ